MIEKYGKLLRFEINVPVEVALKDEEGKPVAGRYGDRVMYTLTDSRVMYVAPIVASRIAQLGIEPGEVFQICKRDTWQGRKKLIEWHVERLTLDETKAAAPKLPESPDLAEASQDTLAAAAPTHPVPDLAPVIEKSAGTQGDSAHGAALSAKQNGVCQPAPTTKLEHALKTAISAAHSAEKFGAELGYVVRFDADAIKSMAITVLINMSEGGRR
jgi:hypothetical protein